MTAITTYDTLIFDLLARITAIQQTIDNPLTTSSKIEATARFWDPIDGPYPHMYNKLAGLTFDNGSTGKPFYRDIAVINMRLIIGSLSAGYLGDPEDAGNKLIYAIVNCFRQTPKLNDPATGQAFQHLAPGLNLQFTQIPNGVHGIEWDLKTTYVGADFLIQIPLRVQLGQRL